MTVLELRALLCQFPDDMEVKVLDGDDRLYDLGWVGLTAMRSPALWERIAHKPNSKGERVVVIA